MNKNDHYFWCWHGLPLLLALIVSDCSGSGNGNNPNGNITEIWPDCGPRLGATPLAPPCRLFNPTPGALEAMN